MSPAAVTDALPRSAGREQPRRMPLLGTSTDTCLQLEARPGRGETSAEHTFASACVSQASQPPATVRAERELAGHQQQEGIALPQHWSNWCKELGAAAGTGAGDSTQCQACHLCPTVLHPPLPPISHPPGSAQHLLSPPCPTRAACNRTAGSSEVHHSVQQCCFHPAHVHLTTPALDAVPREGRCPAAAPWRHKQSRAWAFSRAEPAHVAGAGL